MIVKQLYGHTSEETAFLVEDYPYGGKRCRIRFWLESNSNKGFRFCSQTEHPTKKVWNNPKKSTYVDLAGCMYLDENNHCTWDGISSYSSAKDIKQFISNFCIDKSGSVDPLIITNIHSWCKKKVHYNNLRLSGKLVITMNKAVVADSETDRERMAEEILAWQECINLLIG